MTQYQNLFTTVTVEAPGHSGVELGPGNSPRSLDPPLHYYWLGKIGNAQIGPIYLGGLGLASLICGLIAFNIIGMNMPVECCVPSAAAVLASSHLLKPAASHSATLLNLRATSVCSALAVPNAVWH